MIIGTILPHTQLYGGVKRFLELGNRAIALGHRWLIFTPDGEPPTWFSFQGEVLPITALNNQRLDALFTTESDFVNHLAKADTGLRIFYHVLESHPLDRVLACNKKVTVFANSSNIYQHDAKKYGIKPFKAIGAVDTALFSQGASRGQSEQTTIITYGRFYKKKKGTMLVVKACERLYRRGHNIKLLLFDKPLRDKDRERVENFSCKLPFEFIIDHPVDKNFELYKRADIFASAEKNAGWANTCAEAMASGVAVVATGSGARDFLFHKKTGLCVWRHSMAVEWGLKKLIRDTAQRKRLAENGRSEIQKFDWQVLTQRILEYIAQNRGNNR